MYKITSEIAKYLSNHTKSGNIPGVENDANNPFVPKNVQAIGYMDPYGAVGTMYDYIVEVDYSVKDIGYEPMIDGFWLYKRSELKGPPESVEIPKAALDPAIKDFDEKFDITDCCVIPPPYVDKLICRQVRSIEELFKLEPNLKKCVREEI